MSECHHLAHNNPSSSLSVYRFYFTPGWQDTIWYWTLRARNSDSPPTTLTFAGNYFRCIVLLLPHHLWELNHIPGFLLMLLKTSREYLLNRELQFVELIQWCFLLQLINYQNKYMNEFSLRSQDQLLILMKLDCPGDQRQVHFLIINNKKQQHQSLHGCIHSTLTNSINYLHSGQFKCQMCFHYPGYHSVSHENMNQTRFRSKLTRVDWTGLS